MHELVHGHELNRGDADAAQMVDDRRVGDRGVRAADLLRDVGVRHRQALDVRLVDDRLGVRDARVAVACPVEERVDDDAEHRVRRRIEIVAGVVLAEVVREERLVPVDLTVDGLGVGVEQELVRVGAPPGRGVVVACTR